MNEEVIIEITLNMIYTQYSGAKVFSCDRFMNHFFSARIRHFGRVDRAVENFFYSKMRTRLTRFFSRKMISTNFYGFFGVQRPSLIAVAPAARRGSVSQGFSSHMNSK